MSIFSHEGLCQSALMLVTDDSVEFPETTPSILMSPHRSRSRSPMSPMGSSADSLLVKVDLSKEAACEFAGMVFRALHLDIRVLLVYPDKTYSHCSYVCMLCCYNLFVFYVYVYFSFSNFLFLF